MPQCVCGQVFLLENHLTIHSRTCRKIEDQLREVAMELLDANLELAKRAARNPFKRVSQDIPYHLPLIKL